MAKSSRSKACDVSKKVREEVKERDNNSCIWCGKYLSSPQICHYIGRGSGGLGIPENLACGCIQCHLEADQGTKTKDYKAVMRSYLQETYPEWDETKLRYKK